MPHSPRTPGLRRCPYRLLGRPRRLRILYKKRNEYCSLTAEVLSARSVNLRSRRIACYACHAQPVRWSPGEWATLGERARLGSHPISLQTPEYNCRRPDYVGRNRCVANPCRPDGHLEPLHGLLMASWPHDPARHRRAGAQKWRAMIACTRPNPASRYIAPMTDSYVAPAHAPSHGRGLIA
jgi:hypothetical protein